MTASWLKKLGADFSFVMASTPATPAPKPVFFPAPPIQAPQTLIINLAPNSPAVSPAPVAIPQAIKGNTMSLLSQTKNNFIALLQGKIDFDGFKATEITDVQKAVSSLPVTAQAAVNASLSSLETQASSLVGAGMSAIGPLLADSSDDQATMVLNLLSAAGVPTTSGTTPLTIAEHAALSTIITGLKAGLDRIGIQVATLGATVPTVQVPAPAPQLASA